MKSLYKSRTNKMVSGVCGGIGGVLWGGPHHHPPALGAWLRPGRQRLPGLRHRRHPDPGRSGGRGMRKVPRYLIPGLALLGALLFLRRKLCGDGE